MLQSQDEARYSYNQFIIGNPGWRDGVPDLYVRLLGRFQSKGNFINRQTIRECAIHVIDRGQGIMEAGGKSFEVGPGDVYVFFPGVEVYYRDYTRDPWQYAWFVLAGQKAPWALGLADLTVGNPHLNGDFYSLMSPLFDEIERAYRTGEYQALFPWSAAIRLLDIMAQARGRRSAGSVPGDTLAESIRFRLDQEYMNRISISGLARELGISRITLFRRFRERYGLSPEEHLIRTRLVRARELMLLPETSVKESALRVGFADVNYFCRLFRRRFGVSPGQWKTENARH